MRIQPTRLSELFLHFEPFLVWIYEHTGGSRENDVNAYEYRLNNASLTVEEVDWILARLFEKGFINYGITVTTDTGTSAREGEESVSLSRDGLKEAERLIQQKS